MFLTEKVRPEQTIDQQQMARGRDVPGRLIGQMTVFFISWLVTYSKAYLAGADISAFQEKSYGVSMFMPKPTAGWIPNRVVDLYGRNLLGHLFDLIYFPAKSLFGADFFFVFKLFNATLFAIFLCVVYRYLVDQIFPLENLFRSKQQKRDEGILPSLFVAFLMLSFLPWITEVEMVCYQLPAFLGFVVLTELLKSMPRFSIQGQVGIPAPWLVTIAFVAAFSLEAYSAIMLVAIVCGWALNYPWRLRRVWRHQAFIVSCLLAVFCIAALIMTALYSQRSESSEKLSPTKQVMEFFFANKLLSHDAKLYCVVLFAGVIAPLLILACRPFVQRLIQGNEKIAGLVSPVLQQPSLLRGMVFLLIVLFPTMIITSLISLEAGYNYFSLSLYPWGGFLLIAAFFAVPAVAMPIIWLWEENILADMLRVFLMMLFISGAAIHVIGHSSQYYDNSAKILTAYRAAQRNPTSMFDTGLSLNSMSIKLRPLPTAQSPSDWIDTYPPFFKKYYGVNATGLFK